MNLTVKDVHAFVDSINAGRQAIGMEPIEKIEYDACEPGSSQDCLSAHHLFVFAAAGTTVYPVNPETAEVNPDHVDALIQALGTEHAPQYMRSSLFSDRPEIVIPDSILNVTSVYDEINPGPGHEQDHLLNEQLRDLFVEAGYVDA